jgi:hypothetical protein
VIAAAERLLRGDAQAVPSARACIAVGACGAAAFGLVLGASSGEPLLALFAAVKLPLLLGLTSLFCLPSFWVVHAVLGLRDDFAAALRGLLSAQAVLGLALAAMAPFAVFHTLSVADPYALTLLDGVLCGVATLAAQQVLSRHYRPLIARDPRHRRTLASWLVLYAFTGVQLAWVLRPFRGTPGFGVEFVRAEAFEQNAYVVLFEHLGRLFR